MQALEKSLAELAGLSRQQSAEASAALLLAQMRRYIDEGLHATGVGSRSATIVLASNTSSPDEKDGADDVCDGTLDGANINAAIAAAPSDAWLVLLSGVYNLGPSETIAINKRLNIIFLGRLSMVAPATPTTPIVSIETDNVQLWTPRISGSGTRGDGVGILIGGQNSTAHACHIYSPRLYNLNVAAEFGIVGASSSGDNVITEIDASACQVGINSRGFTNRIYSGYVRTCDQAIVCTNDRPDQKLEVYGMTILSWQTRAIYVQRGIGSIFDNMWLEQTSSGGNAPEIVRLGIGASEGTARKVVNCLFSGTTLMSPGKDASNCELYCFHIVNAEGLDVQNLQISTNGPKNGGLPDTAIICEHVDNAGFNNRFRRISIGPGSIPSGWNYSKLLSKAGTGEIICEEIPDAAGQSGGSTIGRL